MFALPNPLASRRGRLAAFFALYMTEGIPLGFAAVAVATQLRRMGVGPAEIGAFVGSFYVPWAFKWAFGPFVDVLRIPSLGHRRGWIIVTQLMMVATLLALVAVPLPAQLGLFTTILLVHNTFGAMQDVSIDALACNTLAESERGLANGLMFAGAAIGQAVGGAGVLFLLKYMSFQSSFVFVAISILAVTTLVALPMKEAVIAQVAAAAPAARRGLAAVGAEMRLFATDAFAAFLGTRGAFAGVFFALLPAGAMSLGLALQSNLAVEFGMTDDAVATLNLVCSVVAAVCMVVGGWLSDRFGRRRTLALFIASMSLPVLYLSWRLQALGYVMPRAPGGAPDAPLIAALWVASVAYNVGNGLMYGTRSAIFMDVTNPRVAATQFTAYMAMMNLAIAYSAVWLGRAAETIGYPKTLLLDAVLGIVCLLVLAAIKPSALARDGHAPQRARASALVLAVLCAAWLACWPLRDALGAAEPIMQIFYTLVFVVAALFLLAGRTLLAGLAPRWWQAGAVPVALGLLAIYARKWLPADAPAPLEGLVLALPALGAVWLAVLARQAWTPLQSDER